MIQDDKTAHLTDEQFAGCLDGTPREGHAAAHLGECAQCREELKLFRSSVADFSLAATEWTSARPVANLEAASRGRAGGWANGSLQWVAAMVMMFAVALPALLHTERPFEMHLHRQAAPEVIASVGDDSSNQIAQDNTLLESVDMALRTPDASPMQEYRLAEGLANREASQTKLVPTVTQ